MARESTSGSETWRRREFIEKLTTLRQMNPELPRSVSNESQIPLRSPDSVTNPPSLPAPGIPHSWGIIAIPDSLPRMGFGGLPVPVRGQQARAEPVSTACVQPLHLRVSQLALNAPAQGSPETSLWSSPAKAFISSVPCPRVAEWNFLYNEPKWQGGLAVPHALQLEHNAMFRYSLPAGSHLL